MRIGFDAKRAYHNSTGLGNYSRTLMKGIMTTYPQYLYYGFNPKLVDQKLFEQIVNYTEVNPSGSFHKLFTNLWRSKWMMSDIEQLNLNIYHGLSNELPSGIQDSATKSIVTIHDLIFEHFPHQYKALDVKIYHQKFQQACINSDHIIAISEATKKDIVNQYAIPESKITVCLQAVDERFGQSFESNECDIIRKKYNLPARFFISVGSIIERKNLMNVCKAFKQIHNQQIGLVVVGKGTAYKSTIQDYLSENGLEQKVLFLEDHFPSEGINTDLPLLYQMAIGLLYPSRMEGFGLPVLEAYQAGTAVLTSNCSSLEEIGRGAAILIDPDDVEQLAYEMNNLVNDEEFRLHHIRLGTQKGKEFTSKIHVDQVMQVYQSLWH
jgi:glycosyltransferase involved in cell wall biosynthesis